MQKGGKMPEKKYFFNPKFDKESRTFTGVIDWSDDWFFGNPTIQEGYASREYIFKFTQDFNKIESYIITGKNQDG